MANVLLLHAWWGLNDDTRAYADKVRALGYRVATPDIYGEGRVATTIPDAMALMKAKDNEAGRARIDKALAELGSGPVAILGWSMGGSFAWDLVQRKPGIAKALVIYYGIDENPSRDVPTLIHIGDQDEDLPYVNNAATNNPAIEARVYPGAKHWFAEPSRPEFDKAANDLAWTRSVAFLKEHLAA